jgi:hypothetical protein
MPGHALRCPGRRFAAFNRSGGQRVISNDAILLIVVYDERSRRVDGHSLSCVLLEPLIERLDATAEVIDVVAAS